MTLAGREGWVTFALPLPTGTIGRVLESYDRWNSTAQTLVLAFVVEVRDPARIDGGTIKDAKLVSKMIRPVDVRALCERPRNSSLQGDGISQSVVLGLLPQYAKTHDPPLPPLLESSIAESVLGLTTLLLLGSSDVFLEPARRHESVDVETIFAVYFTSNIKRLKLEQMLADDTVFRVPTGRSFETEGGVEPTAQLLQLCPWADTSNAPEQRARGCISHYLARGGVLDFVGNTVYRPESLYAPLDPDAGAAALGSWARAARLDAGDLSASRRALLYKHSRTVGARYNVNTRFRQAYLVSPAMPGSKPQDRLVAQHRILATSACIHTAAELAVRTGTHAVVVPSLLPMGVSEFRDTPYWGRLYASAFRELLGLSAHEVYANASSAVWLPATHATLFHVHIVLPFARNDSALRLAATLNTRYANDSAAIPSKHSNTTQPTSNNYQNHSNITHIDSDDDLGFFGWRVLVLVRIKFAPYFINVSSARGGAVFVVAHAPSAGEGEGKVEGKPSCAARMMPQTFTDVNNADNTALALARVLDSDRNSSLVARGGGRMVQITTVLPLGEFCSSSEDEVLALLKTKFTDAFFVASSGAVHSIEPTAIVVMSEGQCDDERQRRLLQASSSSTVELLAEIVLFPARAKDAMLITTTLELSKLGVLRLLIEPTSIVNATVLSTGPDWIRDGKFFVPPQPVVTPPPAPGSTPPAKLNVTAPVFPDTGALETAHTLFLITNVACMVLFVVHTLLVVLVFGIDHTVARPQHLQIEAAPLVYMHPSLSLTPPSRAKWRRL